MAEDNSLEMNFFNFLSLLKFGDFKILISFKARDKKKREARMNNKNIPRLLRGDNSCFESFRRLFRQKERGGVLYFREICI